MLLGLSFRDPLRLSVESTINKGYWESVYLAHVPMGNDDIHDRLEFQNMVQGDSRLNQAQWYPWLLGTISSFSKCGHFRLNFQQDLGWILGVQQLFRLNFYGFSGFRVSFPGFTTKAALGTLVDARLANVTWQLWALKMRQNCWWYQQNPIGKGSFWGFHSAHLQWIVLTAKMRTAWTREVTLEFNSDEPINSHVITSPELPKLWWRGWCCWKPCIWGWAQWSFESGQGGSLPFFVVFLVVRKI